VAGEAEVNAAVKEAVEAREITRLCHVTPFRNLVHIAAGDGLLSTAQLSRAERSVFNQQGLDRLDAHPDHISCSIEYPNAWYLRQRRRDGGAEARMFPDWVCVCIEPHHLWADSTLFCPRNAAAGWGYSIGTGVETFKKLYAEQTTGAYGKVFTRDKLTPACPTDEQAEVLVYRQIPLEDLQQIVVADEAQGKRTFYGLEQLGLGGDLFEYATCPEFFEPQRLSALLRAGRRPVEVTWDHRNVANV
jgi:ssDNA thymidine ADP-ribosyltransferase, DarT